MKVSLPNITLETTFVVLETTSPLLIPNIYGEMSEAKKEQDHMFIL